MRTTSGRRRSACAHGLLAVGRLADDLDAVLERQEGAQALADDGVVVGEQDADRAQPRGASSAHGRAPPGRGVGSSSRAAEPRRPLLHRRQARGGASAAPGRRVEAARRRRRPRARAAVAGARGGRRGASARRVAQRRCAAPPGRCAGPRGRAPGRRPTARRRASTSIATSCSGASTSTCLRSAPAQPVALEVGRAQLEDQRAQLVERLARERLQPRELRARPPPASRSSSVLGRLGGRARALKSFWLTASCSSSASRLRSERIDSSRLRSYSRALVIAIAACAASSSMSSWSASLEGVGARPCRSGRRRRSRPPARRSARRGTSACRGARPATSRGSAGRAWMSVGAERRSGLEHRAEHAVGARQRAQRAISSSLIPATRKRLKPPSPSGTPSAA